MKIYGILESAQLEQSAANPSPACLGRIYFNTTSKEARIYDGTSWVTLSLGGGVRTVTGTFAAPSHISAAGGITPVGDPDELIFVRGDDGLGAPAPVALSANPQIAVGTLVGDRLTLRGTSDTNYVQIADGTGMNLNGACQLLADTVLVLEWDGSEWKETTRSG